MDLKDVREKLCLFGRDIQELTDDLHYELRYDKLKACGYTKPIGRLAYSLSFELENKKIISPDGSEHTKLNYVERLESLTKDLKDIIETLKNLWSDCSL